MPQLDLVFHLTIFDQYNVGVGGSPLSGSEVDEHFYVWVILSFSPNDLVNVGHLHPFFLEVGPTSPLLLFQARRMIKFAMSLSYTCFSHRRTPSSEVFVGGRVPATLSSLRLHSFGGNLG